MIALSDLFPFIRYEVLRTDDEGILPANELELAIRYILEMQFPGISVIEEEGNKKLDPDLDLTLKRLLILKVSYSLLLPEDSFSYKTHTLSKVLEGVPGLQEHREDIRQRIIHLESESGFPVCSDDEITSYVNQHQRFWLGLSRTQVSG